MIGCPTDRINASLSSMSTSCLSVFNSLFGSPSSSSSSSLFSPSASYELLNTDVQQSTTSATSAAAVAAITRMEEGNKNGVAGGQKSVPKAYAV